MATQYDLHKPGDAQGPSADSGSARSAPPAAGCNDVAVTDDLPRPIPITVREIEAIERHLGTLLDELLAGALPARRTSRRHKSSPS